MSQKVLVCLGTRIPETPWGSANWQQRDPRFPKLRGIQTLIVEFITKIYHS